MSGRSFAISDIHGCSQTFISLLENVVQLKKDDTLFLLGDYIDRGPDSKGVIDYIIRLTESGFKIIALRGNHEEMLLNSIKERSASRVFLVNGGDKTLDSFGINDVEELPPVYIDFFISLEYYALYDKFILVHAGLNFTLPNPFEDKESMLWIRRFQVSDAFKDRVVVHGHTPAPLMQIRESLNNIDKNNRIGIDNGCVYGLDEFYGNLCCLELNTLQLYTQPNIDLKPLF